jgi:hypothetical protein
VLDADRPLLAVRDRHHPLRRDAVRDQVPPRGRRSQIAQAEIVVARAALVGVALDQDQTGGIRSDPRRVLVEDGRVLRADRIGLVVEVDIRQTRHRHELLGRWRRARRGKPLGVRRLDGDHCRGSLAVTRGAGGIERGLCRLAPGQHDENDQRKQRTDRLHGER